MKALGFTMLRKHIKVESMRWYHHCDRLGMIVWQDFVNGGGRYQRRRDRSRRSTTARTAADFEDHRYRLFARDDAAGREEFLDEMRRTVALLRNVTSLAVWVPFNEGWGQFDANAVTEELRGARPDPQHRPGQRLARPGRRRPVEPARLRAPASTVPPRGPDEHRVLVLSEYGGHDLDTARAPVERRVIRLPAATRARTSLLDAFVGLHRDELAPAVARRLSAPRSTPRCPTSRTRSTG